VTPPDTSHWDDRKSNRLGSLITWYSGADTRVLNLSPSDRPRYTGLGGAVLFTAVMAGFSMLDAVHMALHVAIWVAAAVALVWFLGISNLDRWLVSSMRKKRMEQSPWDDPARSGGMLRMAVPRLLMAVLFGLVISTPLTLQIFDPEIQAEIQQIHQDDLDKHQEQLKDGPTGRRIKELQARRNTLNSTITAKGLDTNVETDPQVVDLNNRITKLRAQFEKLDEKATCEDTGSTVATPSCKGTTGKAGQGKWYKRDRDAANRVKTQIDGLTSELNGRKRQLTTTAKDNAGINAAAAQKELGTVDAELKQLQGNQHETSAQYDKKIQESTGLLIRLKALIKASENSPVTFGAHLVLWIFFILIDCMPVFVKLFSHPGAYEELLEDQQELDKIDGRWKMRAKQRADRIFAETMAAERERTIGTLARLAAAEQYKLSKEDIRRRYERIDRPMKIDILSVFRLTRHLRFGFRAGDRTGQTPHPAPPPQPQTPPPAPSWQPLTPPPAPPPQTHTPPAPAQPAYGPAVQPVQWPASHPVQPTPQTGPGRPGRGRRKRAGRREPSARERVEGADVVTIAMMHEMYLEGGLFGGFFRRLFWLKRNTNRGGE
jgi:Domain of unknown function (DUF4407)